MTQKQTNTKSQRCQGWQLARQRLLSLLDRILASARILRSFGQTDQLSRLREIHKKTVDALLRVDRQIERNSVVTRTYTNLRCPKCHEHSVSVTLKRGAIVGGSAKCVSCNFTVRVALLHGAPIAKCPQCGYVATLAIGKRNGGTYFSAFSCFRCNWVSDDEWTSVAFCLLPHSH